MGLGAWLLRPAGWLYGGAMGLRNLAYDRGWLESHPLRVPVVCVGNLSVGGTGKTPLVSWLLARALMAGCRPGVLARGYGRATGASLNDEGEMLRRRHPGLLQVQDPDRCRGGARLLELGADWIVLDDGFQHRRLRRDVDLICVDAQRPFSPLLPAGRQREWSRGLARAHGIVLTRADLVAADRRAAIEARLRRWAPEVPVFAAAHVPQDVLTMPAATSRPVDDLAGRPLCLLSAIGSPTAFEQTVAGLGATVLRHERRRDHHRHSADEVRSLAEWAASRDAALLMTEKDDAKVDAVAGARDVPRLVLRIGLEFLAAAPSAELLRLDRGSA